MKTGDILESTWGYDQTNADFYEVLQVKNGWALIHKLATQEQADGGFMTGYATPILGSYVGKPKRRKIHTYDQHAYVNINTYSSASLWDGEKVSVSHYA